MNYFKGIILFSSLILFSSCIKHEVIPAPKKELDLPVSFSSTKNGQNYELIKDVGGYFCEATQAKEILPTPQLSNVKYFSAIKSKSQNDYVKIEVGKLQYDASDHIDPTLTEFKNYFNNNTNPSYKDLAEGGVQIIYRDANDSVWQSLESSGAPQSFTFESLSQVSDETGDYMKFTAKFNCDLYHFDPIADTINDTLTFQNAVYQGYFKK